ncbi:MAG: GGDEF domain-containing protein [Lachnospirales bacterium]
MIKKITLGKAYKDLLEEFEKNRDYLDFKKKLILLHYFYATMLFRIPYLTFAFFTDLPFTKQMIFFSALLGIVYIILIRRRTFYHFYVINTVEVIFFGFAVFIITGEIAVTYVFFTYVIMLLFTILPRSTKRLALTATFATLFILTPLVPVYNHLDVKIVDMVFVNVTFFIMFMFLLISNVDINDRILLLFRQHTKHTNAEISEKANSDQLTETLNRRGFLERLEALHSNRETPLKNHTLAYIDVDNFKRINDTFGHNFGDIVLKEVSEIMKRQFRESDIVARWGGEEFIILGVNTIDQKAYALFNHLRETIRRHKFYYDPENFIHVTITIGIHQINSSFYETLEICDKYLYYGKKNGKNIVIDSNIYEE